MNQIEIRPERLEKLAKEDTAVLADDIEQLKKENQAITKRLLALETKTA